MRKKGEKEWLERSCPRSQESRRQEGVSVQGTDSIQGLGEAIRYAKLIGWDLGSNVDLRVDIPTRLVRNTLTDLCGGTSHCLPAALRRYPDLPDNASAKIGKVQFEVEASDWLHPFFPLPPLEIVSLKHPTNRMMDWCLNFGL